MPFPLETELEKYALALSQTPIRVKLIAYTSQPYDIAAASARTCYSSKGLLTPEQMSENEKQRAIADRVAQSTLKSGHLTTRQHAHFVFGFSGVSRKLIWQVLHNHPYYNSEQVSQRYVPIKNNREWYTLPPELNFDEVHQYHADIFAVYERLVCLLEPTVTEIFFGIHRLKAREKEKYAGDIRKRCMEVARYVMPLSTNAYLYHTISTLTLLRYAAMCERRSDPEEKLLVLQMLREAVKVDPLLLRELPKPLPADDTPLPTPKQIAASNQEFDAALRDKNATLVDWPRNPEGHLSEAYAALTGQRLCAEETIHRLLSAQGNSLLGETLYPVSMDESSRLLNQLHFTFRKKLSHTADSQEQRHRTLPGSRPRLEFQLSLQKDYILPRLLKENPAAEALYHETMEKTFTLINNLYAKGIRPGLLTSLLPNAFPVRFFETGDLLNFYHKWKARLCYNAQEEIFYSALDEVNEVRERFPAIGRYIGPPCKVRETLKPRCPEGDHFCGIKVWQLEPEQYQRII